MELIILGSGTAIPHPQRASPSLAVFIEDQFLLMDIGPGTVRQLTIAGLRYEDIESQCRKTYQGDLILASDLMSLPVR